MNDTLVFIRRLTAFGVKEENELPSYTLLDKDKEVLLSNAGTSKVIILSAVCTHLGYIPIPHLGAYKGWVHKFTFYISN